MSWNFSFSSRKKTSTRSFFSRLNCSTMVLGMSGITQATTRLRNITRFWRGEGRGESDVGEREGWMDMGTNEERQMTKVTGARKKFILSP